MDRKRRQSTSGSSLTSDIDSDGESHQGATVQGQVRIGVSIQNRPLVDGRPAALYIPTTTGRSYVSSSSPTSTSCIRGLSPVSSFLCGTSPNSEPPKLSRPAVEIRPRTRTIIPPPTPAEELADPPSPYADITRLRVSSTGRGALYPGSIFNGSQKSGQCSYDVNVTLVDVNLSSSTLCGYLRIQNLTQDYPVMTTYFDAEIIGSRFGFLTSDDWGATEQDDLKHWSKFSAFKTLKGELKRPGLTISERERPVTFMRWKERFLVPDHKTKEINGASFAGFYYVAITEPTGRGPATMTGFYFHPYSEPYQQLSLIHVPERTTSSFEFC